MVEHYGDLSRGALIDEAYEFFTETEPESAIKYVDNIDETNLFIVGAATKGLQVPGLRVGWVIASREHIKSLPANLFFPLAWEVCRVPPSCM